MDYLLIIAYFLLFFLPFSYSFIKYFNLHLSELFFFVILDLEIYI